MKLNKFTSEDIKEKRPQENSLWIIPLGGFGEIGKNMLALRYKDEILVIDAGLMFPSNELYGIDYVLADMTYLIENQHMVKALIITHAHEDHIGCVPYFLRKINVPVFGTMLTIEIIKEKLREFRFSSESVSLNVIKPCEKFDIGFFRLEFLRMVHSIPDGIGLAVETPLGIIIHSGDFKFDPVPIDGKPADLLKFAEYGQKGVLALLSDSTYSERPGHSDSESSIGDNLKRIISNAKGRVIITTFATALHRIQQVIDITEFLNKKLCIFGRSMKALVKIAERLGYIRMPDSIKTSEQHINTVKDNNLVILTTGSQGEPMSVLSQLATNSHKWVKLKKQDTVVISSTPIPGNESLITRIVNHLFKAGAEVIYSLPYKTSQENKIHSSGHASQEELKLLLKIICPRYFIPMHGEYRHLVTHAKLAKDMGLDEKHSFILEDGMILEINEHKAQIIGYMELSDVLIDGLGIGDVGKVVMKDRHLLSRDGVCIITAALEKKTGRLLCGPEIITRGFVYFNLSKEMLETAKEKAKEIIYKNEKKGYFGMNILKAELKDEIADYFIKEIRRRPMILPVILEIENFQTDGKI